MVGREARARERTGKIMIEARRSDTSACVEASVRAGLCSSNQGRSAGVRELYGAGSALRFGFGLFCGCLVGILLFLTWLNEAEEFLGGDARSYVG